MKTIITLAKYFEYGGTLDALQQFKTPIFNEHNQPPFTSDKVGKVVKIEPNGFNSMNTQLFRVTYEKGAVQETLSESWIMVEVEVKLQPKYIETYPEVNQTI